MEGGRGESERSCSDGTLRGVGSREIIDRQGDCAKGRL